MTKKLICKKGQIVRSKYTRKSYRNKNGTLVKKTVVPATCINDQGNPGKGPKLFTVKKGDLTKYGYSLKNKATLRRKSLKNSNKKIDKNTLIRKLNALSILQKNTNPVYSRKAKYDMKWVQSNL
jgi:hypothetical protein